MSKPSYMRLKGAKNFRLRLLLATLSSKPIMIDDIRPDDTVPGLRLHEISLLHLIDKVCDGCKVEINETGTKLKYEPGVIVGGMHLVHDCGVGRSVGYFIETLIVLGLFAKKQLMIKLLGITNDAKDLCVDAIRAATFPLLWRFGIPKEGLGLKIESRGSHPHGGGEVTLSVPVIHDSIKAIRAIDAGLVKRIRGVTYSTRVSTQFENTMIHAARGVFNRLLPDVHIATDHKAGDQAGKSPGYGITLVAETTTGCYISCDTAISHARNELDDNEEESSELTPPDEVGALMACTLLEEIKQGGIVDSTRQGLLFLLCALCPPDVSRVRVGKLSPDGIETLRLIRDFLGVIFIIEPDAATETVVLRCKGCGLKNLSRKISKTTFPLSSLNAVVLEFVYFIILFY